MRVLSLYQQERSTLISKVKGTLRRILKNKSCYVFPNLLPLPHSPWPIIFLHNCPFLIKPSKKKYSGKTQVFGVSISSWGLPCQANRCKRGKPTSSETLKFMLRQRGELWAARERPLHGEPRKSDGRRETQQEYLPGFHYKRRKELNIN